jgi:hypothetical protein
MLELLLYCHLFAKIRSAAEIEAMADFIAEAVMQSRSLLLRALGCAQRTIPFDPGSEQALVGSPARLDIYVASIA